MIRAFGQYAQNQSDYAVLVDQINKINSQINVVVNKYNSISNDIFSVSSNISTFNENLNSVTLQLNNLNQSIVSIENEIGKFSNTDYSLAYYITEPVLSKPLWQYNNYSNLQSTAPIIVFEPYVQSITISSHLEGRYYFAYNLPNATLNYTGGRTNGVVVEYEGLTCCSFSAFGFLGTSCVMNTLNVSLAKITNCSLQSASIKTASISNCDINSLNVGVGGNIYNCFLKNNTINGCNIYSCLGYAIGGIGNNFVSCTLANYPTVSNTFVEMNLNNVNKLENVRAVTCKLECDNKNSNNSFVNCTFNDVSIYHLTHTNFINCNGKIYIPRLINGKNMFDQNNQYLGGLPTEYSTNTFSTYTMSEINTYNTQIETTMDTFSTYTGSYTYNDVSTSYSTISTNTNYTYQPISNTNTVLESTTTTTMYDTYITVYDGESYTATRTDFLPVINSTTGILTDNYQYQTTITQNSTQTLTNTLTDNYNTTITYEPQLEVNILPEWKTPNIFTNNIVAENYINTFVDIDYYTDSMNKFELNNCTGNVMMYVDTISDNFIIGNNNLYKCELNLNDYGSQFIITANNIKNLDLYLNSNDTPGFTMSMNNIDKMNLLYNFTATSSIIFVQNSFKEFNINAAANGNLRLSSCTINNGVLYGWNGLYSCEAYYIENYGANSYSKNKINTLRCHDIKLMYDNTIDKLIIEPNAYEGFSFIGNSIKTLVCPSYFPVSASAVMNTFGTIIAY